MSTDPDPITINGAYPWGRNFTEYCGMFALSEEDQKKRILSCADGPASFNAQMTHHGGQVISVDPLYAFSGAQIRTRIAATRELLIEQARKNAHRFRWDRIASPEELARRRRMAMWVFLQDYDAGRAAGRYRAQGLPKLDLADGEFDLALCSHFLFLYSHSCDLDFHLRSVLEMLRVAREARIFPLLDMEGNRSSHLEPLIKELSGRGFVARIERVEYEFQIGGNEMLKVTR